MSWKHGGTIFLCLCSVGFRCNLCLTVLCGPKSLPFAVRLLKKKFYSTCQYQILDTLFISVTYDPDYSDIDRESYQFQVLKMCDL